MTTKPAETLADALARVHGRHTPEAPRPASLAEALAVVRSASTPPSAEPRKSTPAPVTSRREWWAR